ncbi:MAG: STAS domain-containing protein [Anaerolineae bacterium]|nr:STAS domain-containing protein [Anaerolineae bacterium]
MDEQNKSKQQLIDELVEARHRIAELESALDSKFHDNEMGFIQRETMEFAGIGMYRYRFDGSMLFMDRGALRIFELEDIYPDPYAVQGKKIGELLIYTAKGGRLREQLREKGYVRALDYPFKTLKGNDRWVQHDSYVVKDPDTGEELVQAVIRDITAQKKAEQERERLQHEIIEAQQRAIQELSTPIIPVMERIIVMPLVGSIDSLRAKDLMRALLAGISQYRAKVVILDVTGVPIVDTGVVNHLNKTVQAAHLKGTRTIVTGISDAVAETIVDLGIDWTGVDTLADLRTGLIAALDSLGIKLVKK